MRRTIITGGLFFLGLAVLFGFSEPAEAIPAFARKYQTSCATCHAAFPKLNAFGQAFRRLGYHFPEGQDAEMVKEKPVSLGAESYKRVWPQAIWPADIPGSAPIAVLLESEITVNSEADQSNVDFSNMMEEMELLTGGTIGDDINFLTSLSAGEEGVEIEMGALGFYNILPHAQLNLKIGQLPPEVLFVTNHRRFGPPFWITSKTVGDNAWSLEESQKGFEANGILGNGRLAYDVGLVEGRGNIQNAFKEPYVHLAYKFGGLPYNGVRENMQGPSQVAWGDNSLQAGGFLYIGKAELQQDFEDPFQLYGVDIDANFQNLKVVGGIAQRKDKQPFLSDPGSDATTHIFYAEGDYMLYPWLIPMVRYEQFAVNQNGLEYRNDSRIVGSFQALVRANLRAFLSLEMEKGAGEGFDLGETELGLQVGF